jgi:nitric oxide synthase oxygenase domain/subunit
MKRETISWTNDKRTIKDKRALVSLGTQITKIYDKEDVGLIDDETWENLIRVLEQKKRKFLTNAKALWRLKSRALWLENC